MVSTEKGSPELNVKPHTTEKNACKEKRRVETQKKKRRVDEAMAAKVRKKIATIMTAINAIQCNSCSLPVHQMK